MTKRPYVIVPNSNIGDHLCHIFGLPKSRIVIPNLNLLRDFSSDSVFLLYVADMSLYRHVDMLIENLELINGTVINVPEIARVIR